MTFSSSAIAIIGGFCAGWFMTKLYLWHTKELMRKKRLKQFRRRPF